MPVRPSSSSSLSRTAPTSGTSSAAEAMDTLYTIAQLLDTGLDRATLAHCVALIEGGAGAEALAAVVQDLRKEEHKRAASAEAADKAGGR